MSLETVNTFFFEYLKSKHATIILGNSYLKENVNKKPKSTSRQMTKQEWRKAVKECKSLNIKL